MFYGDLDTDAHLSDIVEPAVSGLCQTTDGVVPGFESPPWFSQTTPLLAFPPQEPTAWTKPYQIPVTV